LFYHYSPYETSRNTGYEKVQDLQEVYEIAQHGGMLLFIVDYHLEAKRLCFVMVEGIVGEFTANEHIEKARLLIEETGYKRRLPELEYLQAVLKTSESAALATNRHD
jgi:hypothetical protein